MSRDDFGQMVGVDTKKFKMSNSETQYLTSLLSGAISGTCVDMVLYPLDTIKTRMQSPQGIGTAFVGSAPSAAIFFLTYEFSKDRFSKYYKFKHPHKTHMLSAALAESASCIIRVPIEVIKQRRQAYSHIKNVAILRDIYQLEGIKGYYRGLTVTIAREIPFAFIQYPLWEILKKRMKVSKINALNSYAQGAMAGGTAAALTTPLDVIKTRVMLSKTSFNQDPSKVLNIITDIYRRKGIIGFFAGIVPRVLWMSVGGAIFLGTYEISSKYILSKIME